MLAFVAELSWARLFAATPLGLCAAHVPVVVTPDGTLRFHIADANRMTPHLDGSSLLAVAEGPNAYVSGNWYARGTGVPTWNYVAVECEGVAHALDRADTAANVDDLAHILEPRVGEDWTRGDRAAAVRGDARCDHRLRASAEGRAGHAQAQPEQAGRDGRGRDRGAGGERRG